MTRGCVAEEDGHDAAHYRSFLFDRGAPSETERLYHASPRVYGVFLNPEPSTLHQAEQEAAPEPALPPPPYTLHPTPPAEDASTKPEEASSPPPAKEEEVPNPEEKDITAGIVEVAEVLPRRPTLRVGAI